MLGGSSLFGAITMSMSARHMLSRVERKDAPELDDNVSCSSVELSDGSESAKRTVPGPVAD